MRWLLVILTGLAFMLSACGKIGSGEKIAVVNWDKVLEAHPQYEALHKKQEGYNLLLDRRREQEIIGKAQTLHAGVIGFVHPSTGEYMEFKVGVPGYFRDILRVLRG